MRGITSTLLKYDTCERADPRLLEGAKNWLFDPKVPKVAVTLIARQAIFFEGHVEYLTEESLSQAISIFLQRLSRRYIPVRAVTELNRRLHHAFVWEYGELRGLHEHGWIAIPDGESASDFETAIDSTWRRMRFGDYAFTRPTCDQGWMTYSLKPKTTGISLDHIDLRNVHLPY